MNPAQTQPTKPKTLVEQEEEIIQRIGLNEKEQKILRERGVLASDQTREVFTRILYKHKTVSVPHEAYALLERLQALAAERGAMEVRSLLSSGHQKEFDELISSGKSKFTMGHAFWVACAMAIERLEER